MKAKDVKIGDELYSNTSSDWDSGTAWSGRRVVVLHEVGHWYRKDGEWKKSKYKIDGFRMSTTYGVPVQVLTNQGEPDQLRIVSLGSLRGTWTECDAIVQAARQLKKDMELAKHTKADAKRRRVAEVITQAADLGISGWPYIGTSGGGEVITINPEILSKMLTALAEQGWVLPVE